MPVKIENSRSPSAPQAAHPRDLFPAVSITAKLLFPRMRRLRRTHKIIAHAALDPKPVGASLATRLGKSMPAKIGDSESPDYHDSGCSRQWVIRR